MLTSSCLCFIFLILSGLNALIEVPRHIYIRSVNLENISGEPIFTKVYFKSGFNSTYNIANRSTVRVFKILQRRGWKAVDPIINFKIVVGPDNDDLKSDKYKISVEPAVSIEERKYVIGEGGVWRVPV